MGATCAQDVLLDHTQGMEVGLERTAPYANPDPNPNDWLVAPSWQPGGHAASNPNPNDWLVAPSWQPGGYAWPLDLSPTDDGWWLQLLLVMVM